MIGTNSVTPSSRHKEACDGLPAVSLTITMFRYLPCFLLLLLLSVVLSQRTLSPGRNPLMSGRFIYRAQPEDEQMWINYFNLLDIPLTEELLSQGKQSSNLVRV